MKKFKSIPSDAWRAMSIAQRNNVARKYSVVITIPLADYYGADDTVARLTRERDDAITARDETECARKLAERDLKTSQAAIETLHTQRANFSKSYLAHVKELEATITRLRAVAHVLVDEVAASNGERDGGLSPAQRVLRDVGHDEMDAQRPTLDEYSWMRRRAG